MQLLNRLLNLISNTLGFGEQAVLKSIARWLGVGLLATVSASVVLVFSIPLIHLQKIVISYLPKLNEWLVFGAFVLVLIVIAFPFAKFLRLRHFKTFLSYPPTWLSAFLAFLIASVLLKFDLSVIFWTAALFFAGVILIGTLDYLVSKWREKESPGNRGEEALDANITESMDALFAWINHDIPISHPRDDVFELSNKAIAAARTIASNEFRSLGVVGDFGVGKSSFLNLVEHHLLHGIVNDELRDQYSTRSFARLLFGIPSVPKYVFVRAGMWGLLNNSAEKFVLSAVINSLSQHVDCMRVASMPEKYAGLIRGDKTGLLNAIMFFCGSGSPTEQLQKLEPILAACNVRLIIVIEDLDRNIGQPSIAYNQNAVTNVPDGSIEFNTSLATTLTQSKLVEFEALLDAVKKVEGLSFVFCAGPTT